MVEFLVFVNCFVFLQVFSAAAEDSRHTIIHTVTKTEVSPQEGTHPAVHDHGKLERFSTHPLNHYHKSVQYIHQQNEKTSNANNDNYLKIVQERIHHVEVNLEHLKHQNISDPLTVLATTNEADQSLTDLKQLNLQKLPVKIQNKIEKLEQSVENIKTTILSLGGKHAQPQTEDQPSQHIVSIQVLQDYMNSLENDLKSFNNTEMNQLNVARVIIKMSEIWKMSEKLGLKNIPIELANQLKQLKLRCEAIKTAYESKKGTETNKYVMYLSESHRPTENQPSQQNIVSIQVLKDYMNSLENDLKSFDNAEMNQFNFERISIKMNVILTLSEKLGLKNIPIELANQLEQLKLRCDAIKSAYESKMLTELNKYNTSSDKSELQATNDYKIDRFEKGPEKYTELTKSKLYTIDNQLLGTQEANNKFSTDIVKEPKTTEQLTKYDRNTLQNKSKILKEQEIQIRLKFIESMLQSLKNKIVYLDDNRVTEKHQWPVSQLESQMNQIITELGNIEIQKIPQNIQNEIKILQEKLMSLRRILSNHGNENERENEKIQEAGNPDLMRQFEERIIGLENKLERLRIQVDSRQESSDKTQVLFQVNQILGELNDLKVDRIPKTLYNRIAILNENIKRFKNYIESIINNQNHLNEEKNMSTPNLSFENRIKVTYEIVSMEKSLMNLINKLTTESDYLILTQINIQVDDIIGNLERMEKVNNFPEDLKKRIESLEQNVKSFKNTVLAKIQNSMINEDPAKKQVEQPKDKYQHQVEMENNYREIRSSLKLLNDLEILCEHHKNQVDFVQVIKEATHILDRLKQLRPEYMTENLREEKAKLENKVNSFVRRLESTMKNHTTNSDIQNHTVEYVFGPTNNLTINRKHIITFELILENIQNQLVYNQDLTTIIKQYYEIDKILTVLKQLEFKGTPNNMQHQVEELIKRAKDLKYKISTLRSEKENKNKIDQINSESLAEMENKYTTTVIESRLERFYKELNRINHQLLIEFSEASVENTYTEINNILTELKELEAKQIPNDVRVKIEEVMNIANNLKNKIQLELFKNNNEKPTKPQRTNAFVKDKVEQQVIDLENHLNTLKHQLLLKQEQCTTIETYFEIIQILSKVKKIENLVTSENVRRKLEILKRNAETLKDVVEIKIRTKILNPMENYIYDLLSQLDTVKVSRIAILTRAKIKAARRDLKMLREQIRSLTDYQLIKPIQFHIKEVVTRLQDLRTCHLSVRLDHVISQLAKSFMDIF